MHPIQIIMPNTQWWGDRHCELTITLTRSKPFLCFEIFSWWRHSFSSFRAFLHCTHARTHARTHSHTRTHTLAHTSIQLDIKYPLISKINNRTKRTTIMTKNRTHFFLHTKQCIRAQPDIYNKLFIWVTIWVTNEPNSSRKSYGWERKIGFI